MRDRRLAEIDDIAPELLLARRLGTVVREVVSNAFEEVLRTRVFLSRLVPVADLDTDVDADDDDHEVNENGEPVFVDDVMRDASQQHPASRRTSPGYDLASMARP